MQNSEQKKGFDKVVTHRDPKTGMILSQNPYTLRVIPGANGGKTKLYERPVGSGNLWSAQGEPAGRWVNGKHIPTEAHILYTPPETLDSKLAREVLEAKAENEALKKELASVKAEKEKSAVSIKK